MFYTCIRTEWSPANVATKGERVWQKYFDLNHQKFNARVFWISNSKSADHVTLYSMDENFLGAFFDFMIFRHVFLHMSMFLQCFRSLIVMQIT